MNVDRDPRASFKAAARRKVVEYRRRENTRANVAVPNKREEKREDEGNSEKYTSLPTSLP